MANYTPILMMIIATFIDYAIIYPKNRLFANLGFLIIGLGGMYIALKIGISDVNAQSTIMFSMLIVIFAIISFFYDAFIQKEKYVKE